MLRARHHRVFKREFGRTPRSGTASRVVNHSRSYIFTADSKSNRQRGHSPRLLGASRDYLFYDVIDDPNGSWKFRSSKGMLKRQYGLETTPASATPRSRPRATPARRSALSAPTRTPAWRRVQRIRHRHRNTDAGFVNGTGKLLIKVPETMHFRLAGKLQPACGEGHHPALHRRDRFDGGRIARCNSTAPAWRTSRWTDRMTIANMAIEAGARMPSSPSTRARQNT